MMLMTSWAMKVKKNAMKLKELSVLWHRRGSELRVSLPGRHPLLSRLEPDEAKKVSARRPEWLGVHWYIL